MNYHRWQFAGQPWLMAGLCLLLSCPSGITADETDTVPPIVFKVFAPAINTKDPKSQIQEQPVKLSGNVQQGEVLLKGQVTYVVPSGTPIKLKLASVPTSGLHLMDRDLEGNLHPAQLGQEVTARTTEDLYVDNNKVIPEGTIFHGKVSQIIPPRRVSRPGSLVLSFDYLTTPDGRHFAFRAEADNRILSTYKTKAKGLGIIAAHAAGGAITGFLVAYQLFGPQYTVAMHGYNLAGGAALGAVGGITYALLKHGPQAVLEPGDDLNMEINTDLLLPAAVEPSIAHKQEPTLPGFEIEVLKSKVMKDGLDGHELFLDTVINNDTDCKLNSIDLFLQDDNGHCFPVCAGTEEDSGFIFEIAPHSVQHLKVHFQLEFPKLGRKLVWIDHNTRQPLLSQRLP